MPQSQRAKELLAALESNPKAWISVPVEGATNAREAWKLALSTAGVGALIGVKPETIVRFRSGTAALADHPFPPADGRHGRSPYWWPERADEILRWKDARPGPGAGGGSGRHLAKAEDLPEFDPARPRHAVLHGEHCVWCGRAAGGARSRCPGLDPRRAGRLARLLDGPTTDKAFVEELATELREGLVGQRRVGLSTQLSLSPAGRRWLELFGVLHPDVELESGAGEAQSVSDARYMRIADALEGRIRSGELAPGQRLPGVRELASEYEVSTTTMQQALLVLRTRGMIVGYRGRGNFVPPAT